MLLLVVLEIKFMKFLYSATLSQCCFVVWPVWKGLWIWSSSQAFRQTLTFNAPIRRWATCCGFSGLSLSLSLSLPPHHLTHTHTCVHVALMSWWMYCADPILFCTYTHKHTCGSDVYAEFVALIFINLHFLLAFFVKVLVADINIGYEDIVNTQVRMAVLQMLMMQEAGFYLQLLNALFCFYWPGSCSQW